MCTYKFAGFALPHGRLPKCLAELGAVVATNYGEHRRMLGPGVVHLGRLAVAAVEDCRNGHVPRLRRCIVCSTAATVDGDDEAPFVHELKGEECAYVEIMVGYKPRPPTTDARC